MIYSALIWSIGLGFLFWGDIPDLTLIMGASLIIMSGVYIIYQEAAKHRTITAMPPQGVGVEGEEI
jgi:drug/metabolite transporter (DMT)-like permease